LNGSFFGGDDRGSLKEGVKTYLMAPMSPLNSPIFFFLFFLSSFCLHFYSIWKRQVCRSTIQMRTSLWRSG
jgi:hypothetical protein